MRWKILGRKKKTIGLLTSCLFFIFLTGCGKSVYDTNTLCFEKDGSVIEHLAEEFDTSVYSVDEWKEEATAEITAFNETYGEDVKLTDIAYENGVLRCTITYPGDDAYYELNSQPLFYGTVAQALKAGYSLLTPVHDVNTGEELSPAKLQEMSESRIVILNSATDVNTYKDISYISSDVVVGDDHKKATIPGESTAYIVFD